ncbi:hypothetical protein N7505_009831 [Penicillium chrysogenum]|uniref:Uncharacterized protein n=1 Tax=Penicillium chrysogenum TaxID=5076 RepID=A0ABQ8W933_PENCH|nr:hypothetical protein N7505_009831 [Penicillium chrysogenum]
MHTASRELPDDVSSSDLGQGLSDQRHDDFQGDEHHESNVTSSSQDIIQGGGLEQSTPLCSTSVRDGLCIPVAEEEILSRTEAYENADEATMERDILPHSNPTIDIADGNTMVNGQVLDHGGQEKQSTPTDLLPGDSGIEADELESKPAACVIGKSMPAEKYNRQPVSESHVVIARRKTGLQLMTTKASYSIVMRRAYSEKQSPCSPTAEVAGFCPVLDQPSVVISNCRSQERGTKDTVSIARMASSNRKRDRDEYISDDSSDDPDGLDDVDYVGESGEDAHGNSVPFHRLKRARRPAVQLKPRLPRQNTKRLSVDETVQSKVAADQTSPASLHDIETIPIRGFLTRQSRQSISALRDHAKLLHIMKTKLAASIPSNPLRKGPALGKRPGQPDSWKIGRLPPGALLHTPQGPRGWKFWAFWAEFQREERIFI